MGNLALKFESRCQERKIMASCVGGTLDVRVMKADGRVEEFDRPVLVFEVMYQFPDYVVVQWCPWRNSKLGKRGQLRVLRQHEVLTRGQIYILFPIPVEVLTNTTRRRTRRMQCAKDRLSLLRQRAEMATATGDTSLEQQQQTLKEEKPSEDGKSETDLPSFPGFNVGGGTPKLRNSSEQSQDLAKEKTPGNEEERTSRKPDLYLQPCYNGTWRPVLLSIPESPIGFHSRPETPSPTTPKTPIAFRLVSSRDQAR